MSQITVVSDISLPGPLAAEIEKVLEPSGGRFINGLKFEQENKPNDMERQVTSGGQNRATEVEAASILPQADIIYASDLKAEQFRAATKLKWIHVPFVGVNRLLNIKELVESEVVVTNGRGVIARSVADQVLAFILCFSRAMPQHWAAQGRGEWAHGPLRELGLIDELHGQTVGLIGYGEIGREIGRRAKAFGMRVIATRHNVKAEAHFLDEAFTTDQLPELLAQSDFVVVTAPLTPQTRGMLGAAELALMKPGAYLINIARGPLVREAELIEVLQKGQIAGAGLDVFEREPLSPDSPLWKLPNVIITPHTAGLFKRLLPRVVEFFCTNLDNYLKGEPLKNVVDKKRGY